MTFIPIEIFILIGIAQGLFLIIGLLGIRKKNNTANDYLIAFLIVSTLLLLARLRFTRGLDADYMRLGRLIDVVFFMYCPLLYGYLKQVTYKGKYRMHKIHFIPLIISSLIGLYFVILPIDIYLQMLSKGQLELYFILTELAMTLLNFIYLILSFRHLKKYEQNEKHLLSFRQSNVTYLKAYLWSITICILCWLCVLTNNLFFKTNMGIINYGTIWIGMSFSTYIIAYYSLIHSKIFQFENEKDNAITNRLLPKDIEHLQAKLDALMSKEDIYLDPKLTLQNFSKKINASSNDVSWFLNTILDKSFYNYINQFRIKAFIRKLELNEHKTQTILALSMEVGFNSKSTFNKAFKLEMNETPSHYIKKL